MTYQYRPQALTEETFRRLADEGARLLPNAVARAAGLDVHALAPGCSYIEHAGRCSVVRTDDALRLTALSQGEVAPVAAAARVEAAEQRLEQLKQQARAERARARQDRERAIVSTMQALRDGGHVHHSRAHAIHVLDNEAKWAEQTAAHQARMAAATQPAAPKPAPAPLRVVPRFDTADLQDMVAGFVRRV